MGERGGLEKVLGEMRGGTGEKDRVGRELLGVERCVFEGLKRQILKGAVVVAEESSSLNSLIPRLRSKSPLSPESQIRLHRLKEATRLKQELEQKISFLSESIHLMSLSAEPKPAKDTKKRDPLDTSIEAQKRQESSDFARRLIREQKAMQMRKALHVSRLADSVSKRLESERTHRIELEMHTVEEREKRLRSMKEKAKQREDYMAQLKLSLKQTSMTPEAKATPILPELQLNKRSEHPLKRHLTSNELKEHFKRYSEEKQQRNIRRERFAAEKRLSEEVHQSIHSRNFTTALEETKAMREAIAKKALERRLALEKQRRYSELVKEMYSPAIDLKKAEEIERRKGDRSVSNGRNDVSRGGASRAKSNRDGEGDMDDRILQTKPPVPRFKHKEKRDVTPPITLERPKAIDYLEMQRKPRVDQSVKALAEFQNSKIELERELQEKSDNFEEKQEKIKAKLATIEAKARKNEAMLSRISALDTGGLEMEAGVNDMLITSIRAKLALLRS